MTQLQLQALDAQSKRLRNDVAGNLYDVRAVMDEVDAQVRALLWSPEMAATAGQSEEGFSFCLMDQRLPSLLDS